MIKVLTFFISSIFLLHIQHGTTNSVPRLLIPSSVLNCSTPATIYPLINSCRGWNMCGFGSQSYSVSCGPGACYNFTSKNCNIAIEKSTDGKSTAADSQYWFDCTGSNVGRFMPWKQNSKVYGLCFQQNVVAFMNWCPPNTKFCDKEQECKKEC